MIDREQAIREAAYQLVHWVSDRETNDERAGRIVDAVLSLPDPELEALRKVAEAARELTDLDLEEDLEARQFWSALAALRVALSSLNPRQAA